LIEKKAKWGAAKIKKKNDINCSTAPAIKGFLAYNTFPSVGCSFSSVVRREQGSQTPFLLHKYHILKSKYNFK